MNPENMPTLDPKKLIIKIQQKVKSLKRTIIKTKQNQNTE